MAYPVKYKTEEERRIARKLSVKRWRESHSEEAKLSNKKTYEKNKAGRKVYLKKNKDKISLQRRERYLKTKDHYIKSNNKRKKEREQEDPLYKLSNNIRRNIRRSFSRNHTTKFRKVLKTERLLGCSIPEFTKYLLSKCPEGTSTSDFHQFGYHLDHIVPISFAKTQEEVEKLCHYTNYQPMWWRDNIIKSNQIQIT